MSEQNGVNGILSSHHILDLRGEEERVRLRLHEVRGLVDALERCLNDSAPPGTDPASSVADAAVNLAVQVARLDLLRRQALSSHRVGAAEPTAHEESPTAPVPAADPGDARQTTEAPADVPAAPAAGPGFATSLAGRPARALYEYAQAHALSRQTLELPFWFPSADPYKLYCRSCSVALPRLPALVVCSLLWLLDRLPDSAPTKPGYLNRLLHPSRWSLLVDEIEEAAGAAIDGGWVIDGDAPEHCDGCVTRLWLRFTRDAAVREIEFLEREGPPATEEMWLDLVLAMDALDADDPLWERLQALEAEWNIRPMPYETAGSTKS